MANIFDLEGIIRLNDAQFLAGINKAKTVAGNFAKVTGVAIGAATAAMGALAKSSVDVSKGFDSSMSQVAATMGYSVEELNTAGSEASNTFEQLSNFAQQMGSTTAFSAKQAADALNYMALAGYDADTSMNMLPNVLNLAAAGGIELARASDMVTDAQSALGLSLDQTTELVDKMAKASSKSNTSVEQLGEAILVVGGTAKNLKGGTTELSTALGILADNGIKGAQGGTALRNIITSLSAPTNEAAGVMNDLNLKMFDAEGNIRSLNDVFGDLSASLSTMSQEGRMNVISSLFNARDMKSAEALLAAVGDKVAAVNSALMNSGIAWDKYADGAEAAGQTVEQWVSTWAQDAQYYMNELGMSAEEAAKALSEDYVISLEDSDAMLKVISDTLENQSNRWDELSGYIDDATGAAQAMADVQLDNLEGDITLFKSALEGAQIAIGQGLTPALREFVQFGSKGLSDMTQAFKEGGLSGAMESFGTILADGLTMIVEKVPEFVSAGGKLLSALATGIVNSFPTLVNSALQLVSYFVQTIGSNLPAVASSAISIIQTLADGLVASLPEMVPSVVDIILGIVDTLTDPNNLSAMIDASIAVILAFANGLITALPRLIEKAPEIVSNLVTAISDNADKLLDAAWTLITSLAGALVDNLPLLAEKGVEMVFSIGDGIKSVISSAWDWGVELIQNFIDGILNKARDLVNAVAGVIGSAFGVTMEDRGAIGADYYTPTVSGSRGGNVVNFTQNNYSPKALSRTEIYRQTTTQFAMMQGGTV